MMMMSSLIFEEDGGVMTRKSYAGLKRLSPRGKSGDETVKYMYGGACSTSNSTPIIFWRLLGTEPIFP